MAGGNYSSQSKKQPGVYINVLSQKNRPVAIGDRGIVTICKPLSWGPESAVTEIHAGDDCSTVIGYAIMAEEALFLREIFTGSDHTSPAYKVLLYRPAAEGAIAATGAIGDLFLTAKYKGIRGNDITVSVLDSGNSTFVVQTFVSAVKKDEQEVGSIGALKNNDWVLFLGEGVLTESASMPLLGGSDGSVITSSYADYLTAIEPYSFDILIYDGSEDTVKQAMVSFAKRMRENTGRKCQAVIANMNADSEAAISVMNGYRLSDGTTIAPEQATWWVGGAEAGARYNESLVYAIHPNAVDAVPRFTSVEIDAALDRGQIVFMEEFGHVKVVSDINTLVTYTGDKDDYFALNQVIRTVDTICNDMYREFSINYIGRVQNNEAGRDLLKGWLVGYLSEIQANGGIQEFESGDVTVSAGNAINGVVVDIAIQPVGAIEKIYVTVKLVDE